MSGYIGIVERKMETIIILGSYWGYIGRMEKNMDIAI